MDLLIFLCAQYHLNPSSYTIDLLSAEKNPIKFKPNTPIGMLEAEKVVLKPKVLDKKKPTPIIPEVRDSLQILESYGWNIKFVFHLSITHSKNETKLDFLSELDVNKAVMFSDTFLRIQLVLMRN